eukprot:2711947-Pyramimonas_sp.AAC.1
MNALWTRGRAYRSPAITLTLITKGHCLDPTQISTAQPLLVLRRVLTSPFAARVLPMARRCWDLVQQQARRGHDLRTLKPNDGGPMARLTSVLDDVGWTWPQADAFRRANGQYVYLTKHPQGWWRH